MTGEKRVALTPALCRRCVARGARVLVERGAGRASGFPDQAYRAAGGRIIGSASRLWAAADLIVKVKEPVRAEFGRLRRGQALFAYLHLATEPALARVLLRQHTLALAYESVRAADGSYPLLIPMSQLAGRLAIQTGTNLLETTQGGSGILLGRVGGAPAGHVVIVGAGSVGAQAAAVAVALGARVTVLDIDRRKLAALQAAHPGQITTRISRPATLARAVAEADLLVGAVLIPGARTPVLITRAMLRRMHPGSAIVDLTIDQGGCVEGIRPTSHARPTYRDRGVTIYAVRNTPALVARTATLALTHATGPYLEAIARLGLDRALAGDPGLAEGITVRNGRIVLAPVAQSLGFDGLKG